MSVIPEILRNFDLREHSGNRLNIVIERDNFNAFIAILLIFKQMTLIFIPNSRI